MESRDPNPYKSPIKNAVASSRTPKNNKHLPTLILLFELPVILLLAHGLAYLFHVPGSEVVANEYGGKQPVAFTFFRFLSTGGLLLLFVFGCWQTAKLRMKAWLFGLCIGISYIVATVAWWALIGLGVMMRFT